MERATVFAVALFVVFYVYVLYLILSLAFLFPQQERYQREESQRAYARGAAVSAAGYEVGEIRKESWQKKGLFGR